MIISQISPLLEELGKKSQPHEQLDHMNPESGRYQQILNQRVRENDGFVQTLSLELAKIGEMRVLDNTFIKRSPQGGQSIRLNDIAHWALAQTRKRAATEVLDQLKTFISTKSVPMSEVIAIWGINTKFPIKVTNDISIVPFESLIQSDVKDQLTGIKDTTHTGGTSFPHPRPKSALKYNFFHNPFDPDQKEVREEKMREIIKCLCLLNSTSVCEIAHWFECEINTPIIGGVMGWSGQAIEHAFHIPIEEQEISEKNAQNLVAKYLGFNATEKSRLNIPLNRLNTALRRFEASEIALELGISLEGLLDPGDSDISYKIRQRGAYLIGDTPAKKQEIFNILKQLYNIRSKVAHGSEIEKIVKVGGTPEPIESFVEKSKKICVEITRKIVDQGFIKDWDGALLGW